MAKEGYFERLGREIAEARQDAAIRELDRAIKAGKFPENDDTINAFAAGWYGTYEYQKAEKQPMAGETSRLGAMMTGMIGLMLVSFYLLGLFLHVPMKNEAWWSVVGGVGLLVCSYLLARRSGRKDRESRAAFKAQWGKKEKTDGQ